LQRLLTTKQRERERDYVTQGEHTCRGDKTHVIGVKCFSAYPARKQNNTRFEIGLQKKKKRKKSLVSG
jgi:hypothetical protein